MFLKSLLSNLYSPMEGSGKLFGPVTGMLHCLQSYQLVLVSERTASFVRLRIPPQHWQEGGGGKGEGEGMGRRSISWSLPPSPPHGSRHIVRFPLGASQPGPTHSQTHNTHNRLCQFVLGEKTGSQTFFIVVVVVTKPRKPRQK